MAVLDNLKPEEKREVAHCWTPQQHLQQWCSSGQRIDNKTSSSLRFCRQKKIKCHWFKNPSCSLCVNVSSSEWSFLPSFSPLTACCAHAGSVESIQAVDGVKHGASWTSLPTGLLQGHRDGDAERRWWGYCHTNAYRQSCVSNCHPASALQVTWIAIIMATRPIYARYSYTPLTSAISVWQYTVKDDLLAAARSSSKQIFY